MHEREPGSSLPGLEARAGHGTTLSPKPYSSLNGMVMGAPGWLSRGSTPLSILGL